MDTLQNTPSSAAAPAVGAAEAASATSQSFIKKIGEFLMEHKYAFIAFIFFASLLLYIAYRIYKSQVEPGLNYEGPEQGGNSNIAQIFYFYTEWCPHCKQANKVWEQFVSDYSGNTIKNYKLKFIKVDCDKDEAIADKYKVDGYPTIKLVKDKTVYEYDAKPNLGTLGQFLNSVL